MADFFNYLVYINLALTVAASALALVYLIWGHQFYRTLARWFHLGLFVSLSFNLMILLYFFLTTNLDYAAVVEYSSKSTPTLYKISGLWAGREGTLLIWVWTAVGALGFEDLYYQRRRERRRLGSKTTHRSSRRRSRKRTGLAGELNDHIRVIGLFFIMGLGWIQCALNPLAARDVPTPVDKPLPSSFEGFGLNPLLQTPWMAIHPPIIFIAFGLMIPVLASGLAYLITHKRQWVNVSLRWARWSWVLMGASLILGAYWAYVTLGWGGYWAWDPVETASLLPWIGLTAFLHIALMFRKKQSYEVLGPLMASLVVALTIFESFVTRGGIWVSVHSFVSGGGNSAWDRFINVIDDDRSVLGFFLLMMANVAVTAVLTIRAMFKWPAPQPKPKSTLNEYINDESTMYATAFTLLLLLAITLVLLLLGVNGTIEPAIYNTRLTPLVLLLAFIFILAYLKDLMTLEKALYTALGVMALTLLGAMIGASRDGGDDESLWMLGLALPLFIGILGSILLRVLLPRLKDPGSPIRGDIPLTVHFIHAGMALLLVGYAATSGLTDTNDEVTLLLGQNNTKEVMGYEFTLVDIPVKPIVERDGLDKRFEVQVMISKDGKELGTGYPSLVNHTSSSGYQITTRLFILHRIHEDIYVSLSRIVPSQNKVEVTIKVIPLVGFVWAGSMMIMVGEVFLIGMAWPPLRKALKWRMPAKG